MQNNFKNIKNGLMKTLLRFLASQDALEVTLVSHSLHSLTVSKLLTVSTDLTKVTIVSDDTF